MTPAPIEDSVRSGIYRLVREVASLSVLVREARGFMEAKGCGPSAEVLEEWLARSEQLVPRVAGGA